jgi:phosphonoacetaldehyde hydrolase
MESLRAKGVKTGSTTGYSSDIMKLLLKQENIKPVLPGCIVTPSDTPQGRPKPWMCFLNAQLLDVYPLHHMIKVGDTEADIAEGINAGMWTIGLTMSGNEAGISHEAYTDMTSEEINEWHERLSRKLIVAGACYTAQGIWECSRIFEDINLRISRGEMPLCR